MELNEHWTALALVCFWWLCCCCEMLIVVGKLFVGKEMGHAGRAVMMVKQCMCALQCRFFFPFASLFLIVQKTWGSWKAWKVWNAFLLPPYRFERLRWLLV